MIEYKISRIGWDDTSVTINEDKSLTIEQGEDTVIMDKTMWMFFHRQIAPEELKLLESAMAAVHELLMEKK